MGVPARNHHIKFFVVGGLLLIAVVFMVISATRATADFFMTVEELKGADADRVGDNLRVSGAVLGETIHYDTQTGLLHFTIAHIPADEDEINAQGGLETVLHEAVIDQSAPRLDVVYAGPPPDMLKDEAQAILTGTVQADGTFLAEELLLKCPSKYEEALPEQVES
ncbi:MAG: cytochrome c maturation protein CcmE [Anaerolineaceae bacterium]|nr:cytochrome c maturation protein CcmE [Anaerolineaceae bacterium]